MRRARCLVAVWLVASGALLLLGASEAQQTADSPGEPAAAEPRQQLYNFLLTECRKHFQARRQEIEKLQTPEAIRQRQEYLRGQFLAALGGFPEKTPLHAQTVGQLQGEGFRVEKVIFESRPNHHVTALLYLPEGRGPFPGVLMPCGHSANGKAAEAYQRGCISLAKHGFAVLCYDPIGQGERYQILSAQGKPAIPSSTTEHTLVGVAALLVGWNTATFRIWDGIRALDYLASRPEVDSKRLGCTGNSGGGTLTAYLMALDDRIQVAAPSCYITSLERLFETIGPQDAEQNITGQVVFGLEHADYVTLRAPKPTLLLTATYDFFDIRGSWETFREAKRLYCILGHGERIELAEFPTKHGFHRGQREAMLRWMRRWLQQRDEPVTEPDFPVFTEAQVQCTRTGQVLEDLKGASVFDIIVAEARRLRELRQKASRGSVAEQLAQIKKLLSWREPTPAKTISVRTGTTRRWMETEPGITVLVSQVERSNENGLTLCVVEDDRDVGTVLAEMKKHGLTVTGTVWAMSPRGMGGTAKDKPTGMNTVGRDWKEAFLALHLNRPLLGQRAFDVLSVLAALRQESGNPVVQLIGVGRCGPIVLHAAAFDAQVNRVTLYRSLAAWELIPQEKVSVGQLANVVPGALAAYDLPELAALLAPRSLEIVLPTRSDGTPCDAQLAGSVYRSVEEAYRYARAANRFFLLTPRQN